MAVCAEAWTVEGASDPLADGSYVGPTAAAPFAKIKGPDKVRFKNQVTVKYWGNTAPGTVTLKLDGRVITTKDALTGPFKKKLPKKLAVGKHTVRVLFNPSYDAPTVKAGHQIKVHR